MYLSVSINCDILHSKIVIGVIRYKVWKYESTCLGTFW